MRLGTESHNSAPPESLVKSTPALFACFNFCTCDAAWGGKLVRVSWREKTFELPLLTRLGRR